MLHSFFTKELWALILYMLPHGFLLAQDSFYVKSAGFPPLFTKEQADSITKRGLLMSQKYDLTLNKIASGSSAFQKVLSDEHMLNRMNCRATDSFFDGRKLGFISPVKNQNPCGSCWAFAATSIFEANYKKVNNVNIVASEQELLDCAWGYNGDMNCDGGYLDRSLQYITENGLYAERTFPYIGFNQVCTITPAAIDNKAFFALSWGFVGLGNAEQPTINQIKQAICDHGAVGSWMRFYSKEFYSYQKNNIYEEVIPHNIHEDSIQKHFVTIVGWDDSKRAWLIKNSWGKNWGDKGFGWIKYTSNSIGYWSMWIESEVNRASDWRPAIYSIMQNTLREITDKSVDQLLNKSEFNEVKKTRPVFDNWKGDSWKTFKQQR